MNELKKSLLLVALILNGKAAERIPINGEDRGA